LQDAPADGTTPAEQLFSREAAAIHLPRRDVLNDLYRGALEAARRFQCEPEAFSLPRLHAPFVAEAEYRAISPSLIPLFGELPPRVIRSTPRNTAAEAIREFYTEIEWKQPDGERIRQMN